MLCLQKLRISSFIDAREFFFCFLITFFFYFCVFVVVTLSAKFFISIFYVRLLLTSFFFLFSVINFVYTSRNETKNSQTHCFCVCVWLFFLLVPFNWLESLFFFFRFGCFVFDEDKMKKKKADWCVWMKLKRRVLCHERKK